MGGDVVTTCTVKAVHEYENGLVKQDIGRLHSRSTLLATWYLVRILLLLVRILHDF